MSGERGDGCAFCDALKRQDGPENLIVLREPDAMLVLNKYPYNSGHCMVVPRRHVTALSELSVEETAATWGLVARVSDVLQGSLGAHGVNVGVNLGGAAGGSIEHLHVHLVPRWVGDTNFLPVIGGAKVLVELLEQTYARFRSALQDSAFGDGALGDGATADSASADSASADSASVDSASVEPGEESE